MGSGLFQSYEVDNVRVDFWTREYSWRPSADTRIKEYRTMDVKFDLRIPNADHIKEKLKVV